MTMAVVNYGGSRSLPVHATVEYPGTELGPRWLIDVHVALLELTDGQILRIHSPASGLPDQLQAFEGASGHAVLSTIEDADRPGWTSYYLRKGAVRTTWTDEPGASPPAQPARAVAGQTADELVQSLMPRRLWLYTNFDCNLACDYCCVVAGPRADPRRLGAERIHALVQEAADAGLEHVFLTGGEPTLRRDLPGLIEYVTDRLPMTLLTNAMLLRGPRWEGLQRVIASSRPVTFQVSLDSATRELHDRHRGRGAHARALEGIRTLQAAGAHVRLAASLPEAHLDEIPRLQELADTLGIAPHDRIFRPIALRGAASEGEPIRPQDIAPELTADAQGWFWHPLSNDADMRLDLPSEAPVLDALAAIRGRLTTMVATRSSRLDRFVCG